MLAREPNVSRGDRQVDRAIGGGEQLLWRVPARRIAHGGVRALRQDARDRCCLPLQTEPGLVDVHTIAAGLLGLECEELADRHAFAADVTATPAPLTIATTEREDQLNGLRRVGEFCSYDQPLRVAHRKRADAQRSATQERIA